MTEIIFGEKLVDPLVYGKSLTREKPREKAKERVIFVGSFLEESKSGGVGGQMFACKSLVESELSDHIDWLKIDSTADTNLERSLYQKAFSASLRLMKLLLFLLTKRKVTRVLIFTSNGLSFYEKGLMALISRLIFSKKVIVSPRSGRLINDLKVKRNNKFIRYVFSKCEHIVCQGEYWKKLYSSEFPDIDPDKFTVIKNWINPKNIDFSIEKEERIDGRILFLGWLEKDKGIFDLVAAAKKLKDDGISFEMIIAGEGKYKWQLEKDVHAKGLEGQVKTPGWVKGQAKTGLLKSGSIFVLPSYFEGMPNALMEAMAFGMPSVATNIGGIPDLINHEKNGLLAEPGDVEGIYQHLKTLLLDADLRNKMGQASRESVLKGHLVNLAIKEFKKLLLTQY